jgi:hypothetical protein
MENEFIPEKQSIDLKELGFNEPCFAKYENVQCKNYANNSISITESLTLNTFNGIRNYNKENGISAPLFQQAFRWFRENHGLFFNLNSEDPAREDVYWYVYIFGKTQGRRDIKIRMIKTYKEAELSCLIKLIEIVKNKQK